MSGPERRPDEPSRPRAVIFGCAGPSLLEAERQLYREADPCGFILFEHNCEAPDQVRALVDALREAVGRADAPVLIDQEGGPVARLGPPHWRAAPAAAAIGALASRDRELGRQAARLNARLLAAELHDLGITVNCLPVLDIPAPGAHAVIGERAFGTDPEIVAILGAAACWGLLDGGVLPVLKHIPGHGRAMADSHTDMPVVEAPRALLDKTDFHPFRALAHMPWAMTAHILYKALDDTAPATMSRTVIGDVIRREIGFRGVLLSDDLSMGALVGGLGERARAALAAGCDLALHSSGVFKEMEEIAAAVDAMSAEAAARLERAEAFRHAPEPVDTGALAAQLDALMGKA